MNKTNEKMLSVVFGYYQRSEIKIYKIIGAELKKRRLKLSKTLSSIPGMSISYISKIENSKIVPSEEKLRCICHEIDINDQELDALLDLNETIEDVLRKYYQGRPIDSKETLYSLRKFDNFKTTVIKLIIALSLNKIKDISKYLDELTPIMENMESEDIEICVLAQSALYYANSSYLDLIELANISIGVFRNPYVLSMLKYYRFLAYGRVGYSQPTQYFMECLEDFTKYGSPLIEFITSKYYEFLLLQGNLAIKNPNFPHELLNDNLHALYSYKVNKNLDEIDKSKGWVKAYLLYEAQKYDQLDQLNDSIYYDQTLEKKDYMLVPFYYLLSKKDYVEIREYTLNTLLPFTRDTEDYELMTCVLTHLMTVSVECSRYRESICAVAKYFEFLEIIKNKCSV